VKNFRNLLLLLSIVTGAVVTNAQNAVHGKFQLSSEVRWANTVLPAGDYSFVLESNKRPLIVKIFPADGRGGAMVIARSFEDARPGSSKLFVTENGSTRIVRSMNLPQLGISLIYEPITQREREKLYTSQWHTVPVQLAKN